MKVKNAGLSILNEDGYTMTVFHDPVNMLECTFAVKIKGEEWWCDDPREFLKVLATFVEELDK